MANEKQINKAIHCPHCGSNNTKVTNTNNRICGDIERRRLCLSCGRPFKTLEKVKI